MEGMPARGASKAWLHLGGRLGRVAGGCLVAQNFLYIFAALFFLLELGRSVNPRYAVGHSVAPDSVAALASLIAGVEVSRRPPPLAVMAIVAAGFACVAVMPLVMSWAEGKPREAGVGTLDSAILAGGWGIGAAVLLGASLAFLAFVL